METGQFDFTEEAASLADEIDELRGLGFDDLQLKNLSFALIQRSLARVARDSRKALVDDGDEATEATDKAPTDF